LKENDTTTVEREKISRKLFAVVDFNISDLFFFILEQKFSSTSIFTKERK